MKKEWFIKTLALGIVVLSMILTFTPSIGISNYLDDTTPPVTIISFDPLEPDGLNGWYVSSVTVTLNATDDDSGVNVTIYKLDDGPYSTYIEPFIIKTDGFHKIRYFSIDNAGNQEDEKSAEFYVDQTKPEIWFGSELAGGNPKDGYDILFTADALDETSGMNRVEFYYNNVFQEVVYGSGPTFQWIYHITEYYGLKVGGLILNPEITDEYVKFYALVVITLEDFNYNLQVTLTAVGFDNAGNADYYYCYLPDFPSPHFDICLFKNIILPIDYHGYIGNFFIRATFDF